MKMFFAGLFVAILAFTLSGCDVEDGGVEESQNMSNSTESNSSEVVGPVKQPEEPEKSGPEANSTNSAMSNETHADDDEDDTQGAESNGTENTESNATVSNQTTGAQDEESN